MKRGRKERGPSESPCSGGKRTSIVIPFINHLNRKKKKKGTAIRRRKKITEEAISLLSFRRYREKEDGGKAFSTRFNH